MYCTRCGGDGDLWETSGHQTDEPCPHCGGTGEEPEVHLRDLARWMPKWAAAMNGEISVHYRLDVMPRITVVRPGTTDVLDSVIMPEFMTRWHARDIERFKDVMNHRV